MYIKKNGQFFNKIKTRNKKRMYKSVFSLLQTSHEWRDSRRVEFVSFSSEREMTMTIQKNMARGIKRAALFLRRSAYVIEERRRTFAEATECKKRLKEVVRHSARRTTRGMRNL